jgi:hypothetical protein
MAASLVSVWKFDMNDRLLEVVKAATQQTARGGLEWRAFDDQSFRTPVGTGYLHLQRRSTVHRDEKALMTFPAETFSVQVSNVQGRIVAEREVTQWRSNSFEEYAKLFEAARNSAMKSNEVLEDILRVLHGPDVNDRENKANTFRYLLEVVKAATQKTVRGGLEWKAFDDQTFRTPVGTGYLHLQRGSTVLVDENEREYPAETFSIQVSDAHGRSIVDGDATQGRSDIFEACGKLFEAARNSALKSNEVLEDILRVLQGPDVKELENKAKIARGELHSPDTLSLVAFVRPDERIFVGQDAVWALDLLKKHALRSGELSEYVQEGLLGDGTLRVKDQDWNAISGIFSKMNVVVCQKSQA